MKIKNYKKFLIIPVPVVLAAGLLSFIYFKNMSSRQNTGQSEISVAVDSGIDLSPPTEQELKETESHKTTLDNEKKPAGPSEQIPSLITPIITSADTSTIRGYISGISEDGGICTATFRKESYTFSKQSKGFRDASTTVCEPIIVERADFSVSGEWTVQLSYASSMAQGKSEERKFMVN